jgi:hypothetical protein
MLLGRGAADGISWLGRAPDELLRISTGDEEHLVLLGDGQRRLALLRETGQDLHAARHRPL